MYIYSIHLTIIGFILLDCWIKVHADEVTVISINRQVPGKLLACFNCRHSRSSPNPDCINSKNTTNIPKVTCKLHEPFCRVRKLMNNDHVELLERSCAQTCRSGCEKKISKVQTCASCCVHRLCNTGNGASARRCDMSLIVHFMTLTFISAMYRT